MEKYRVYAGIDLDAVRYNMESMHNNINKDTKIVAVVKNSEHKRPLDKFRHFANGFHVEGFLLFEKLNSYVAIGLYRRVR